MATGYLKTKAMVPEDYGEITHSEIIHGEVKLFSDVKTMEEDISKNEKALAIAWAVVFRWLKATGGNLADKLRLFLSLFASKDMQERGMNHHVAQTGKAKSNQGIYARYNWVVDMVLEADEMYRENSLNVAIPGVGGVPWTMYWTRLGSGTAAVAEIGRGVMRRIYRPLKSKEKLPISGNVLLEAGGMAGFGVLHGNVVSYTDIWNDQVFTGLNLNQSSSVVNTNEKGDITIVGGVLGMKIIGIETEQEFPYTRFWAGAGMIPESRVERKTIEAYFWKDELESRPKRLQNFTQADKLVAEKAKMTTHGWTFYVTQLWPRIIPTKSPFAGKPLEEWSSFPDTARDVEKHMVEWLNAAAKDSVPMDEVKDTREALHEDEGVWEKIVEYMKSLLKKNDIQEEDLVNGVAKGDSEDTKAVAASLTWKAGKNNFSYYVKWWGVGSFAPLHSLEIGEGGLLRKVDLKQDDLDNSTNRNALKNEYDTLRAIDKAKETTHLGFLKGLQVRFGIIKTPGEDYSEDIKPLIEANIKMGKKEGTEAMEGDLKKVKAEEEIPKLEELEEFTDKLMKTESSAPPPSEKWIDRFYPDVTKAYESAGKLALVAVWNMTRLWVIDPSLFINTGWKTEGETRNATWSFPGDDGSAQELHFKSPVNVGKITKKERVYFDDWREHLANAAVRDSPMLKPHMDHLSIAMKIFYHRVVTAGLPNAMKEWPKNKPVAWITPSDAISLKMTIYVPSEPTKKK